MFNNQGSSACTNQPFCFSVEVALGRSRGRHVTNGSTWKAADSRKMKMWKWLHMRKSIIYDNRVFKLMPRWANCNNVLWDYVEKRFFSGINDLHLSL
jgi:hypothetical protein